MKRSSLVIALLIWGLACLGGAQIITADPGRSQTVVTNVAFLGSLTLSVDVPPGLTNHFLWQFNGRRLIRARTDTYTMTNMSPVRTGLYSVLVSNELGVIQKSWQVRVVHPGILIFVQPADQCQLAGGDVYFTAAAVSSNAVTYQWRFHATNLPGATSSVLKLSNVQAAQAGNYDVLVSDGSSSLASSNASFTLVTPPVIDSQPPPDQICLEGKFLNLRVAAKAPGSMTGDFPLSYQWQWNGADIKRANASTYGLTVNDTNTGIYTVFVMNAAGRASTSWRVSLTNVITASNDLLLIYNTNSADSRAVLAYYLTHRPNVSDANVLGIGYTNPVTPGYYEAITTEDLKSKIFKPISTWLAGHPAKRPQYVILFMDLPGRVCPDTSIPNRQTGYYPLRATSSICIELRKIDPDWQPYVSHLNMGMTRQVDRTDDCIAYINKLAKIGTPIAPGSPVLSARANGYSNTNYVLDGFRNDMYAGDSFTVAGATNTLLAAGVMPGAIHSYDDNPTAIHHHCTAMDNLAGYASWGCNGGISADQTIDGSLSWHGDSGWWLINTVESYNGEQVWLPGAQGTFIYWFSSTAFGGVHYSNTPIGAVSTVEEPYLGGKNDNAVYLGLWARGKNFGICAWDSMSSPFFQATGDPLVAR